jgi:hypothetical protein
MEYPKLLDVVALLEPLALETLELTDEHYDLSTGLPAGTVGRTVVEVLPHNATPAACLVEFSDPAGCGYAFATVPIKSLLPLHYVPLESMEAAESP